MNPQTAARRAPDRRFAGQIGSLIVVATILAIASLFADRGVAFAGDSLRDGCAVLPGGSPNIQAEKDATSLGRCDGTAQPPVSRACGVHVGLKPVELTEATQASLHVVPCAPTSAPRPWRFVNRPAAEPAIPDVGIAGADPVAEPTLPPTDSLATPTVSEDGSTGWLFGLIAAAAIGLLAVWPRSKLRRLRAC